MSLIRFILVVLLFTCGCAGTSDGPVKYPVSGIVTINGKPAERMAVTFHHPNATLPSNLRYPTGVTDVNGRFTLSSQADKDGAIQGDYKVTFSWLSSPNLDAFDMLGGALGDPAQSKFQVSVPTSESINLIIDFPENKLKKPR